MNCISKNSCESGIFLSYLMGDFDCEFEIECRNKKIKQNNIRDSINDSRIDRLEKSLDAAQFYYNRRQILSDTFEKEQLLALTNIGDLRLDSIQIHRSNAVLYRDIAEFEIALKFRNKELSMRESLIKFLNIQNDYNDLDKKLYVQKEVILDNLELLPSRHSLMVNNDAHINNCNVGNLIKIKKINV